MEDEIWQRFRDDGVEVIALGTDQSESQLQAFVERHEITFPVLQDVNRELYNRFATERLPLYLVVIGPEGQVHYSAPEIQWLNLTTTLVALTRDRQQKP